MRVKNFSSWRVLHYEDHVVYDYQLAYLSKTERKHLFNEIVYNTWTDSSGALHLELYDKCPSELALQRARK